jgi:NAD(P)-dependent dehydrogenase (short-subunit alcohol dehydrogenase family)
LHQQRRDRDLEGNAFALAGDRAKLRRRGALTQGSGCGSIVLVASVNGMAAAPGSAAYDVSKAALIALARAIAVDYGGRARDPR